MLNAYGLPDDGGAAVDPQFGTGSVAPNAATPSFARGGLVGEDDDYNYGFSRNDRPEDPDYDPRNREDNNAAARWRQPIGQSRTMEPDQSTSGGTVGAIPEDPTGDSSPNTDVTDYSNAMAIVRQALNFGRQQHGLPASRPQEAREPEAAIPEEEDSGGEESYEDGGAIEDDTVAAHEREFPDFPPESESPPPEPMRPNVLRSDYEAGRGGNRGAEYGRPQRVAPDMPENPEQTATQPAPEGPIDESAGLNMSKRPGFNPNRQNPSDPSQLNGAIPDEYLPHNMLRNGAQQIMRYLQRADAMPEAQAQQLEAAVSGGGIGSDAPHDRNEVVMKAVEAAGEPPTQFAYLQRNAKRYEGDLALAFHAAQGTPERPPNLGTAAQRANAAFSNVPDATDVRFAPGDNGMTVAVRPLGSSKSQHYDLTPQQFLELTKPGGAGQWDKIVSSNGVMGALNSLVGGQQGGAEQSKFIGSVPASTMDRFSGIRTGPQNNIGLPQEEGGEGGGKNFTEGSRPSTPSESQDMALMRREAAMRNDMNSGMRADQIAKKYGPDPRPMAGANGVVSFPGYKAYQQKYGGAGAPQAGRPVTVMRGADGANTDKTYVNGVDQSNSDQENKLELIRAKNEGRPAGRGGKDYENETKLAERKHELRMKELELQDAGKTGRAALGIGSREKIAADRLALAVKQLDAANDRSAAANAVRALNGRVLSTGGQNLSEPKDKALYEQITAGAARRPPAPAPTQVQGAPQVPTTSTPQLTKAQILEILQQRGVKVPQ